MSFSEKGSSDPLSRRNILSSYKNRIIPLTYNIINFTSQDQFHPINFLLLKDKKNQSGWISNRFCIYPQEILIKFPQMVNLRQINILINESKIPKMIEFINCIPLNKKNKYIINKNKNLKEVSSGFLLQNIGFIKLSSNVESNYKARELRKIYININTEYLKLKIHRNYLNNLNMFCQVGIVSLEFFGIENIKSEILKEHEKYNVNDTIESLFDVCFNTDEFEENLIDDKIDKLAANKIKELTEDMNKKKEKEEYEECKIIKEKIDKIRKIAIKIYILEEQKKDYANKNNFDKAKEIKFSIEKIRKLLDFYLLDKSYNIKEININNKDTEVSKDNNLQNKSGLGFLSQSHQELNNNVNFMEYDDIILPTVMKRIKKNNSSFNKSGNNSAENSYDSLDNLKINEHIEKEPLEDLDDSLKNKYELLICFIGEDTIKKIFSKFIYYKEEGFDILRIKVKEIISGQKNTSEANKYIVKLMEIVFVFLDDRHPSIVYKCLDIFHNILKSIEEKSKESNVSYDFTITKKILNKIKEKLNDISKKVRTKAADLYCFMLETDFCEYNTLLIELIENEVFNHFNKYLLTINKNKNKRFKFSLFDNYNNKYEVKSSKQLIITKMGIFLRVLKNFNDAVKKHKTDKQKFPQNILGDFIIMNINHPKDDVREITKDVMAKFIGIFGNKIFTKMQMVIEDKELSKIIQDKKELKIAYNNLKNKKNNNKEEKDNKKNNDNDNLDNININNSIEGIFLTNVHKKFKKKNNPNLVNKLVPAGKIPSLKDNLKAKAINDSNKKMIRSTSQPKFGNLKPVLKPIKRNNKNLINSRSQVFENLKK